VIKHHGKWLADWRDENGIRKRKSFATWQAARKYENEQKGKSRGARKTRSAHQSIGSSEAAPKSSPANHGRNKPPSNRPIQIINFIVARDEKGPTIIVLTGLESFS
jgi:hypothetical protein